MSGGVSLPMYDLPGLQPLWDEWWGRLFAAMAEDGVTRLSTRLTRLTDAMDHWRDPGMTLSQTCGYPFIFGVNRDWRLLATPVYDVQWCDGPLYRNLILVRRDDAVEDLTDLRGRSVAYNGEDSHSGYNSIRWMIAPLAEKGRFFARLVRTGGHLNSIRALAAGEVDCCSVDCVTYALIAKHGIAPVEGLRVLAKGPLVPGLPFILRRSVPDDAVTVTRTALMKAVSLPEMEARNRDLLIAGFEILPDAAYGVIGRMDEEARTMGYPALA